MGRPIMPTVKVSEKTLEWLKELKKKERFKTLDGVVRHLLPTTMQEPKWEDYDTIFRSGRAFPKHIVEEFEKKHPKDPKMDLTFIMNLANDGLKFAYRDSDFRGENDINMAVGMTALAVRNIVFYLHRHLLTEKNKSS